MKALLGLVAAAGVVVAGGLLAGLVGLVVAAVAVVVAGVVVTAFRLPGNRGVPRAVTAEAGTVEASHEYRRLAHATTWAKGSMRDWDQAVRPVLAELAEQVATEQDPTGADDRSDVARRILGDELWPLVDPARPRSEDRSASAPGEATLFRIIDRLEPE